MVARPEIDRVGCGNVTSAFEAAVSEFGAELFGLAIAITGNREDGEDAYQSAMEQAWQGWGSIREPTRRRAWMASICARTALRTRRRRGRWLLQHSSLEDTEALATVMSWDPDLAGALTELSPRQRAVVTLHYGHGHTLDDVATILGCRGGTVRSHLARALDQLRWRLSDGEN